MLSFVMKIKGMLLPCKNIGSMVMKHLLSSYAVRLSFFMGIIILNDSSQDLLCTLTQIFV